MPIFSMDVFFRSQTLFSFLVIGLLILCHASPAGAQNIVPNGGFEDGSNGWSGGELSTDLPHSGSACLLVADDDQTASINAHTDGILPIEQGQPYEFSVWARAETLEQTLLVTINQYNDQGSWISGQNLDFRFVPGTQWSQVRIPIRVLDNNTAGLRISLRPVTWTSEGELLGRAWFDDVEFTSTDMTEPVLGTWLVRNEPVSVWLSPVEQKVRPDAILPTDAPALSEILLNTASGEYEPAEIVLASSQGDHLEQISISELVGPDASTLGSSAWTIRQVDYVTITNPSDHASYLGPMPDPLPLLELPMELPQGKIQPLWLTLHVPAHCTPGDYTGTVTLTYRNSGTVTIPLRVHVWNFDLPKEHHLRTAYGLSMRSMDRYHFLGEDKDLRREVFRLYLQDFAAHRISPYNPVGDDWYSVSLSDNVDPEQIEVSVDFSSFDDAATYAFDELGFDSFRLWLPHFASGTYQGSNLPTLAGYTWGSDEYEIIYTKLLSAITNHLADRGWLNKAYAYWFDEPHGSEDYAMVIQGMDMLSRMEPRLNRLLTEEYDQVLAEHVDIWTPLLDRFAPDWASERQAAGDQVWWYVCTGPKAPYPNNFIDHPGIEHRIRFWMAWKYQIQGSLYWSTTYWTNDTLNPPPDFQDPWQDPASYSDSSLTNWGNGDGKLLYPPKHWSDGQRRIEGPTPSIRWELIREGIEDYEYLFLLDALADELEANGQAEELVEQARELQRMIGDLITSTTEYTSDPDVLGSLRSMIGDMIERLKAALEHPSTDGGIDADGNDQDGGETLDGENLDASGQLDGDGQTDKGSEFDGGGDSDPDKVDGGCGCASSGEGSSAWMLWMLLALTEVRRKSPRPS